MYQSANTFGPKPFNMETIYMISRFYMHILRTAWTYLPVKLISSSYSVYKRKPDEAFIRSFSACRYAPTSALLVEKTLTATDILMNTYGKFMRKLPNSVVLIARAPSRGLIECDVISLTNIQVALLRGTQGMWSLWLHSGLTPWINN